MNRLMRFCLIVIIGLLMGAAGASRAGAQEVFRNPAMETDEASQMAYNNARKLMVQGRFDAAIKEFNEVARQRNGKCAECFQMIGQINLQLQNYKDAAAAFRQAAELKPVNEAELFNAYGVALYLQNDKKVFEEAIRAFNRSIELSKGKVPKAYYNLGYTLIKAGREEEGKAALKAYLEANPSASDASAVQAVIANPKLAGVNFAPVFKIKTRAGDELSLEKLKGKIVLLDFWATWCVPCLVEMPEVKKMWKKYGGDKFVIIGVSIDDDEAAFEKYVEAEQLSWPQYLDTSNQMSRLYNVRSIPHTVLIDHEGIIRAVGLKSGSLSGKIGELLKTLPKQETEGASSKSQ
jgi:tetratricopeptide (TPR) repeat protein